MSSPEEFFYGEKGKSPGPARWRRWAVAGVAVAVTAGGAASALLLVGDGGDEVPIAGPTGSPVPGPTGGATPGPTVIEAPPDGLLAEVLAEFPDDGFSFEVEDVSCGLRNIITAELRLTAEGRFCVVTFSLTNEGDERGGLDISCQFLHGTDGEQVAAREDATYLDPNADDIFSARVEPGETFDDGGVIFDVPKTFTPAAVELNGACGTPGVRIEL